MEYYRERRSRTWCLVVQLFVLVFGYFRLFIVVLPVIFGYFRSFSAIFGHLRLFAAICGYLRLFAAICGYLRSFSAILSRFKSLFGYFRSLLGHNSCNQHVTGQLEIALNQCESPLKRCLMHVTSM